MKTANSNREFSAALVMLVIKHPDVLDDEIINLFRAWHAGLGRPIPRKGSAARQVQALRELLERECGIRRPGPRLIVDNKEAVS
jgi:hypothetical protein